MTNIYPSDENEISQSFGYYRFDRTKADELCTAFSLNEIIILNLYIPRKLGITSGKCNLYLDESKENYITLPLVFNHLDHEYDVYKISFPKLACGLYFYSVECNHESIYAKISLGKLIFSMENTLCGQITVYELKDPPSCDFDGAIMYHIFVDRFSRGSKDVKPKEGCIINPNWNTGVPEYPTAPGAPLKNNVFFGGTLWGIIEKLDYLSVLCVNVLYLSPIFESPSNHKYDTSDYMSVDEMFGGEEALNVLIKEAHKRNIKIILDGVFNHTGADSVYFNKYGKYPTVGAYQSEQSKYRKWFYFGNYKNGYASWWDIDILPKLNLENKGCRNYFVGKGGVIEKYASLGIDGFRLDVADELSDNFIKCIRKRQKSTKKGSILIGEVWEDASNKIAYDKRKHYYLGDELDSVMNYPLRNGVISYFLYQDEKPLSYALKEVMMNVPPPFRKYQMNFLSTHDTMRILNVLAGVKTDKMSQEELARFVLSKAQKEKAKILYKMAFSTISFLPGMTSVFYGDEAGVEGANDPFNRRPFPWENMDDELLSYCKKINKVKNENSVFRSSDFEILRLNKDLLIFSRFDNQEKLLIVIYQGNKDFTIHFSSPVLELISNNSKCIFIVSYGNTCVFDVKNVAEITIA